MPPRTTPNRHRDGGAFHHWNRPYGALACPHAEGLEKAVAYSSVSHPGFCTLGIFALNPAVSQAPSFNRSTTHLHRHALLIVGVVTSAATRARSPSTAGLMKVHADFTVIFGLAASVLWDAAA